MIPRLPQGPVRLLAAATVINTMGNGAFLATSVLYLTRIVGLAPVTVGVGLGVAGVFGVLTSVPVGRLADRSGARRVTVATAVLAGVAVLGFLALREPVGFVVVAVAYTVFDRGSSAARQALLAGLVEGSTLVETRAYLRSLTNVGVSIGAGFAAVALLFDTREAYWTVLALNALTYVASGLLYRMLPEVEKAATRQQGEPRIAVLRDRPYVALTVVNTFMLLHIPLLEVVLPLWVTLYTDAPRSVVAGLLIVNTVVVVLLQVRVSRGVGDIPDAMRALTRSAVVLALSCALFALAAGGPPWVATLVLVAAAVFHVVGEMLQSSGSWVLAYELAPRQKQGEYQALFNSGQSAATGLAPAVLILLIIEGGPWGWVVLALVFLVAQALMRPVVTWALRGREIASRS